MIAVDTHTHSVASGHAYSTVEELARAASLKGLQGFVLTDHAPTMPGGAHLYHFYNQHVLPRRIHQTLVFRGAEVNILNSSGEIDLGERALSYLDFVVASLHEPTFSPTTPEEHTAAYRGAMRHPLINAIGHPDDDRFPYDIPAFVQEAGETGTLIEVNNTSLRPGSFRRGARENYQRLLKECRKAGVKLVLSSDAHFSGHVGDVQHAVELLQSLNFPPELVANRSLDSFLENLEPGKAAEFKGYRE